MSGLIALVVGASLGTTVTLAYRRRTLGRLLRKVAVMSSTLEVITKDAVLADWCRHMQLTVVTVSGKVFSSSLADLQASEVPDYRNWNVPVQVVLWSVLDEHAAKIAPKPDPEEIHG